MIHGRHYKSRFFSSFVFKVIVNFLHKTSVKILNSPQIFFISSELFQYFNSSEHLGTTLILFGPGISKFCCIPMDSSLNIGARKMQ